ncbi:predicted protein [Nematostella vectensis]|uniref:ATP-grasp domain-containing protein n=1 Tax=Nematostella vectensis TaxID=45351 RepID=A7T2Z9_NEMVE|nr:uncharacterized protein LOC5504306 isoform X2 [Nematostella vectensis]EDO29663.1 predicted protein [Nematostella vectensis]|eukprot:XP_001621763.1 hypothetical protein NEMVEDRAFT_v1g221597 [Nematostella vectensis]
MGLLMRKSLRDNAKTDGYPHRVPSLRFYNTDDSAKITMDVSTVGRELESYINSKLHAATFVPNDIALNSKRSIHASPNAIRSLQGTEQQGHQYVTLTSLLSQDVPYGAMLLEFPSSSNTSLEFVNSERFLIYDFPPPAAIYNEYLLPLRACPVAGDSIPLLLRGAPSHSLSQHWLKWVPGFTPPFIKHIHEVMDYDDIVTSFPHQMIPSCKHAVDPEVHYKLLSKNSIPEMGAHTPHHMTMENHALPCMVKAAHGKGTKGTFKADTEQELEQILVELRNNLQRCEPPILTEVIEDIDGNYCLQFYLHKSGEIYWLGVTTQIMGDKFVWGGGVVDWTKQLYLRGLLWGTICPVKEYLHKQGYFGIVGIDVLTSKRGKFVIDVNPRINGTTPQLFLAPRMADLGYGLSVYIADGRFLCTSESLVQRADVLNSTGEVRVVVLSSADIRDGCEAHVVVFGESEEKASEGFKRLKKCRL